MHVRALVLHKFHSFSKNKSMFSIHTLCVFLTDWPSGQLSVCNQAVVLSSSSVSLVSSLYSNSGYIINGSNFICGMHVDILPL